MHSEKIKLKNMFKTAQQHKKELQQLFSVFLAPVVIVVALYFLLTKAATLSPYISHPQTLFSIDIAVVVAIYKYTVWRPHACNPSRRRTRVQHLEVGSNNCES